MRLVRPGTEGRVHTGENVDALDPVGMPWGFHDDDVILSGGEGRRPWDVTCKLAVDIDLRSFRLAQLDGAEWLGRVARI